MSIFDFEVQASTDLHVLSSAPQVYVQVHELLKRVMPGLDEEIGHNAWMYHFPATADMGKE